MAVQNSPSGPVTTWRFVLLWGAGWAAVGSLVAAAIAFSVENKPDITPFLVQSVLFAEVVGFTALVSSRFIFPYFTRLSWAVRILLRALTLFSATLFGSGVIAIAMPLFTLARLRTVAIVVVVNATLAVVVGIALHTYESMRRQIEESYQRLREREAIERQMEIAQEVQKELFPKSVPKVPGLEMAGVCLPAVGIGGDYYDFLPMGEHRVGLVIADVSGKGIPAALLMAGLQASVRGLARPTLPAAEVNRLLNDVLYRSTSPSRYATLFYGVWDGRDRSLLYSNAGHNPPIQIGSNGHARLTSGGIPLGVLDDAIWDQERRFLLPGDIIALWTDGVTEATDPGGQEFGEQRLVEILTRHRDRNLEELVQIVLDELNRWLAGHPPQDDLTLVLARAA